MTHAGINVGSLKVATLNICSMRHKMDDVRHILTHENIDILGVTETWLDSGISDGEVHVDGYGMHRLDRGGRRGGGVCIYYRNNLPVKPRPDLSNPDVEAAWLEICSKDRVVFGCLYRPPQARADLWEDIDDMLSASTTMQNDVILCGDFNVDMSPGGEQSTHRQALVELCATHNLQLRKSGPTRIAFRAPPTVLDLILVSRGGSNFASEVKVIDVPFSDHSMVLCDMKVDVQVMPEAKKLSRNMQKINMNAFRDDLAAQPLCDIKEVPNVDHMWRHWRRMVMNVLDRHAPLRPHHPRKASTVPWMDDQLLYLIAKRKRLHRRYIKQHRDADAYAVFRKARTEAHEYNRRRKSEYFLQQCALYGNQPKQMWRVINQVTGRKKQKGSTNCPADVLGKYFHSIVTDTTSADEATNVHTPRDGGSTFAYFHKVTEETVQCLLANISPSKATGSDGLPGFILKSCSDILAPSLTLLFNRSLESGCFPEDMKIANICPIFKSGDKTIPSNYRPVSMLSIVSKLLERVVHRQLHSYLNDNHLLPDTQFAYRRNCSTEDALMIATEKLLTARDNNYISAAAFIDLSKAFDKVKHNILLTDLQEIGIDGAPLQWFRSYLSKRRQRVVIGASESSTELVTCGVPQGSVLGPTLFSLYVRNIRQAVPANIQLLQFADDIMLQYSNENAETVQNRLSNAVSSLSLWLSDRGLILNETKSQVLWIPIRQEDQISLTVKCNNVSLPNVREAKYLGVLFDEGLTWKPHVNWKSTKTVQAIGALTRARNCLTTQARQAYYSSVIMPNLLYGSSCFVSSLSSFWS